MIQTDILIVGAGITGTALAREMSRYNASVTVIESGSDVAEGATKANSGIVHAGYDAIPGTLKAKYNVRGAAMFPELCERLSVPYQRCGAMIVGFDDKDKETLENRSRERKLGRTVQQIVLPAPVYHIQLFAGYQVMNHCAG